MLEVMIKVKSGDGRLEGCIHFSFPHLMNAHVHGLTVQWYDVL